MGVDRFYLYFELVVCFCSSRVSGRFFQGGTIGFWHLTSEKMVWGDMAGKNKEKNRKQGFHYLAVFFFSRLVIPPTSSTPVFENFNMKDEG